MEIVTVKVRPSYYDKKMHVLRFLYDNSKCSFKDFKFIILQKLNNFFPKGYFTPVFDRKLIDFSLNVLGDYISLSEYISHDYLSKYLYSSEN